MFWIILGCSCLIYYSVIEYAAKGQQMTMIWLFLAILFFLMYARGRYRKKHPRPSRPLWVRTFCYTSLILLAILAGVVESRIIASMLSAPKSGLSYIVILSQNEITGETQEELEARLDCAVRYLKANPDTRVIVSGGWDSDKGYSKAHVMYEYLLECGVENNRISWEARSLNGEENLRYSMSISGGAEVPLGLVTSNFYSYRAARVARNVGLQHPQSLPAQTSVWLLPHRLAQEFIYVLRDKFFGV